MEFIVLTLVSILVVIVVVRYSLRLRKYNPVSSFFNIMLLVLLEIICMLLGKYGANWGLPWWIYYTIPMLLTIFVPILYFKMNKKETITYLVLTFVSAPIIHIIFSLFGWNNFMPFIKIPSLVR
jgi:hypothetical protein